jgi:TIR domain
MVEETMYPYRVFISYSHSDRRIVELLVEALKGAGVTPMWDQDLLAGAGFSEQIQRFIANSHVFLAFLTDASAKRIWLHQEIGFATALGKPIVPVTLGTPPEGIISGIQAVQLRDDLADAAAKLSAEYFSRLIDSVPYRPATYECTEDNARRALLLARYADSVSALGKHGEVRQMASLSTFHLPDRGPADPIWKKYFAGTPDDVLLFDALRQERVTLGKHARECGFKLILDPVERLEQVYWRHGTGSVRARVNGLLTFLRDDSVRRIVVAVNDDLQRNSSVTLVGDWFSSEAVSSGKARVLREALFTRDSRVVRQQIEDFDNRMRDLLANRGWEPGGSRAAAIEYLQTYLDALAR